MNAGISNHGPGSITEPRAEPATLENLEAIIEKGLPNYEGVAFALLEIYEGKLFKREYGSFKRYMEVRWNKSRSRGYQLLHLARLKKLSTMVDIPSVQNERQARALAPHGAKRPQNLDPIERAMQYLVVKFEKLTPEGKRQFIDGIRGLLDEMESLLKKETSPGK